jgi:glyoxylase-like metal-dependent hydrolase (beta-lactamase superfamily II)
LVTKYRDVKEKMGKITIPTPFAVGDVNVYLLIDEVISLVDVGPNTPEAWEALELGLREYGLKIKDIDQIILTHHHPDHCGLALHVQQHSGAKLYCHQLSEPFVSKDPSYMQHVTDFFDQFYVQCGVPLEGLRKVKQMKQNHEKYWEAASVDGLLDEGSKLPGHSSWEILHVPGHAQDQLSFYHAYKQLLLASDHLIKHISSNALLAPPPPGESRPRALMQYRDSMQRCADMPIIEAYSGHGESIRNVRELVHHRITRIGERAETIFNFLREKPRSPYELGEMMFHRKARTETHLVISEVVGHLDLLEARGQVTFTEHEGILFYHAVQKNGR